MAHVVVINDKFGEFVDHAVYCSDFCAQEDEDYTGWAGCIEISFGTTCESKSCAQHVCGIDCYEDRDG